MQHILHSFPRESSLFDQFIRQPTFYETTLFTGSDNEIG